MRTFNWVTGWLGTGPKAPPVLDDIILTERVWDPELEMDLLPVLDDVILMELVPDHADIPTVAAAVPEAPETPLAPEEPVTAENLELLEIVPVSELTNEQFYASGLFQADNHRQPDWPPFAAEDFD
ncbi:hypothetical protein [Parathalassolituus penaei]|uniref:Uncharacterized protein n=1 Tax=Parathalassolituus penaei TaxID=2997323 RepID=A0A9X3IQZ5_9GAMM|nr:hypothetical protein [Parathalassolituus penaei]MCY0964687.1 hypothetical protein [Parathalassolituus penaei]